jgi:hypothetical protein
VKINSGYITMSRTDDQNKMTQKEQEALEEVARKRPGSTLHKEERTARFLQQVQRKERGEASVTRDEIRREVARPEKYGVADWEIKALLKQPSGTLWDALGEFVRLSDTSRPDFISRYPEFLPVWFYRIRGGNNSDRRLETNQMAWQVWRTVLREAWHSGFHPEFVAQLVNIPTTPPGNTLFEVQPVCDAQQQCLQWRWNRGVLVSAQSVGVRLWLRKPLTSIGRKRAS